MTDRMTPEGIRALRQQGKNQTQIAHHFGVTRQAVSDMVHRYGIEVVTPRMRAQSAFPWKVSTVHKDDYLIKLLRDHVDFYANHGGTLDEKRLRRLVGFYSELKLNDHVVQYSPEVGATRVPREEVDGGLLIRLNEHARSLTEEELAVWEFPEEVPRVRRSD